MENTSQVTTWGLKLLNFKMELFLLPSLLWRWNLDDNVKGPALYPRILGKQ